MNEDYKSNNLSQDDPAISKITSYIAPSGGKTENPEMTNARSPQKETGKTGWKMPEPVFRVSEGYCPLKSEQSAFSEKQQKTDSKTSNSNQSLNSEENLPDITLFNVDLSELKSDAAQDKNSSLITQKTSNTSEQAATATAKSEIRPENKSKNKIVYVVLTIFGIFLMLFLAVAITGVAYFWFYYRTNGG